jgi:hypothetical protein
MQLDHPSALNCPNCGAPLHPGPNSRLALCLYCGSSIRLEPAQTASPAIDATLEEKELAGLKQLLLDGGQKQAVRLYVEKTGADEAAARMAVGDLGRQISLDIIRSQNLTPYGAVMVTIWTALLLASLAAAGLRLLHPLIALALAAFAIFNLLFFAPALRTSLRFLGASVAPATTLQLAQIGVARLGGQKVHTLLALLEVHPTQGQPFKAEMLLPVRDQNLERAKPGAALQVKYLPGKTPGDAPRVIYYGPG